MSLLLIWSIRTSLGRPTLRSVGLPNDVRMLQINNNDMAPYASRGDVVVYDPRHTRIQGNGVFVLQIDERYIVRRVQRGLSQSVRLICDNPLFGDELLDETDSSEMTQGTSRFTVVGLVVGRLLIGG